MKIARLALAVSLLLSCEAAFAETITHGTLELKDPWARAMPPGARAGGGFMVITNGGKQADRLVGGSSPRAGRVEIHEMKVVDDIMKMRQLPDGLEIPAGGSVELKPGSFHVMFLDVGKSFTEGETIPVTLDFAKAGSITIDMPVKSIAAGAHMKMKMQGKMKHMNGMQGMGGMQGMQGMGGMQGMQGQ